MKGLFQILFFLVGFLLIYGCKTSKIDYSAIEVADDNALVPAKKLYHDINAIAKEGIAFGHQDATAYGVGWQHEDHTNQIMSDVKKVTGKFPAIHGFDIGHLELGKEENLDTVSFALMKDHIQKLHEKGALITMSWHANNPVSGGGSWETTLAVSEILEGGQEREKYELWIKRLATFFKSLKTKDGESIPVVFRPFHEMNGSWFWWGGKNTSPEEYKQLWRETVQLLQENDVHNLLYAYSPNTMSSEADFDKYFPGSEYVDVLGVDIYNHSGNEAFTRSLKTNLEILRKKGAIYDKPFALTEGGNNNFGEDPFWWTQVLYPGIKNSGAAWMLMWRNDRPSHYFATYPGEVSEEDFKDFEALEEVLFLDEVEDITN